MHILPGLIPFIMWFVYHDDPLPMWNVAVAAGTIAGLTLLVIKASGDVRRDQEENWPRTCAAYAIPPVVALLLFPGNAEFASVTVCVLAFGDSAAALAGRLFGNRALPWNSEKTWMGLMFFVLLAAPLGSLAYWGEAKPTVSVLHAAICGCSAALPAGLVESLRSRKSDNLRIGFVALAGVVIANRVLVGAF